MKQPKTPKVDGGSANGMAKVNGDGNTRGGFRGGRGSPRGGFRGGRGGFRGGRGSFGGGGGGFRGRGGFRGGRGGGFRGRGGEGGNRGGRMNRERNPKAVYIYFNADVTADVAKALMEKLTDVEAVSFGRGFIVHYADEAKATEMKEKAAEMEFAGIKPAWVNNAYDRLEPAAPHVHDRYLYTRRQDVPAPSPPQQSPENSCVVASNNTTLSLCFNNTCLRKSTMPKTRKWNEEYVRYGFTVLLDDRGGPDRAQCMTCHFIMCNSNLKPARLKEHQAKHPAAEHEQTLEALQAKRARYDQRGTLPQLGFKPMQKPLLRASYEVAYQCIKVKASHSAPENLIKPCAIRMVELILGTEAAKKIKDVPLSNDVIGGRVADMSCDILDQIVQEIKDSPIRISLQLDESTDVSNMSQLIVYARYIKDGDVKDEFLFCEPLQTTTKADDVFGLLANFFEKHQIKWEKIRSVCTDGAPAMIGNRSGFAALLKKKVPDIIAKHCFLHRHALAAKTLPPHLKDVLSICVQVVNFIRGRPLHHRVFKLFCEEMGSEHQVLLFHTEVRWLSRGKILTRLAELKDEIAIFLREYQSNLAEKFEDEVFILSLSYMADIFSHLNDINLFMQGMYANNILCTEKIEAFKKKLTLWKHRVEGGSVINFPILEENLGDKTISPMVLENIVTHLSHLETTMNKYFPHDWTFPEWIQQPFLAEMSDADKLKEEFIDLQENQGCKIKFRTSSLSHFWCDQLVAYPGLARAALEMITPFPTTYLCEKAFSTMLLIKTNVRNRLHGGLVHDMRVALANTMPRYEKLVTNKQQQKSH